MLQYLKRKEKKLSLKTWKNRPQKLLIIGPELFFSVCTCPVAPKQKSCTTKSPLMQDWVFRLALAQEKKIAFVLWSRRLYKKTFNNLATYFYFKVISMTCSCKPQIILSIGTLIISNCLICRHLAKKYSVTKIVPTFLGH